MVELLLLLLLLLLFWEEVELDLIIIKNIQVYCYVGVAI